MIVKLCTIPAGAQVVDLSDLMAKMLATQELPATMTIFIPNVPYLVSWCEEQGLTYRVVDALPRY